MIYKGHDEARRKNGPEPKTLDQPEQTPRGTLTQNGLFHRAAAEFQNKQRPPERVHVYEKIRQGIWSYNGIFHLIDSWTEQAGQRTVFKFKLLAVQDEGETAMPTPASVASRRVIPTIVKLAGWARDGGKCVMCGAKDNLHFDHIIPVAKGGTSTVAENIQLLCARHNLAKSDKIV